MVGIAKRNKKMCEFNKEDVLILARAVTEDPITTMTGDHPDCIFCEYCGAELNGYYYSEKDLKHKLNCPVLIAQDILTRNP